MAEGTVIAEVLGPLRVTLDGRSVVPTAPKARKLLALLLLNRGRVVRTEMIEQEAWGASAPKRSATSIQNHVLQIRRCFATALHGSEPSAHGTATAADEAKRLLATEPTGYRLAVSGEEFDLCRYQGFVTQAHAAEQLGDLSQAAELLRSALALWRDSPLADLPAGPVLESHVLRLEEERKAALRRRIFIDLRLQRYEVVGELQALAALHPFDEMLHECLMVALNSSGRRSDALSVYQSLRSALADEIGLEPSSRLQALQRSILRADAPASSSVPLSALQP